MKNLFKNLQLTPEEQEIEAAIERGDYKPVANFEKEKKRLEVAARNTIAKRKSITVRLSEAILCDSKQ